MSSPYVVLGDRPLDQWKVTELKEELKKRKLTIRGLKEDLVKRLDEAVRLELEESANESADNGSSNASESELPSDQAVTESVVSEGINDPKDIGIGSSDKVDGEPENRVEDQRGSMEEFQVVEADLPQETNIPVLDVEQATKIPGEETTVVVSETIETTTVVVSETIESTTVLSGSDLVKDGADEAGDITAGLQNDISEPYWNDPADPISEPLELNQTSVVSPSGPSVPDSETQNEAVSSTVHLANDVSNVPQPESDIQLLEHQVSKVDSELRFEVSDSISTESVTNIEKNELKVDVFTDNVTLELDVKHEMVQPSLRSITPDGGESHPMDAEEPHDKKDLQETLDKIVSEEETGGSNRENVASPKNIDNKDLDPPEKLNLELTSGEDPMEEDILPSEQVEYKTNSSEIQVDMEQSGIPVTNEDNDVDVVGVDKPAEIKVANAVMAVPGLQSAKRKMHDNDAVGGNDTTKRSRRWNTEGLKGSEPDSSKAVASAIPMDSSQPTPRRLSRSDSTVNEEAPKERVVPPSSKPPTNSLRIDQFLRPFTLKAVQELLGKTGTITSFWMDHIKTHCYISYSSVEEAVETRNAVYNLQWPPNGGRMLVAEFVDPQEVKTRIDPPPAAPSSSAAPPPPTGQPQPSPRQQLLRQQFPPQPLPPPPPIRERPIPLREAPSREQPLQARDRLNLPPPPPLPEKVEPPIVTLDDLFKKTKSTPRIYYLPLSDEQVAVKLASQKNIN